MKEIFKKIEGKQWDWFGEEKEGNDLGYNHAGMFVGIKFYTLADLLANKSWCKAVWEEDWEFDSLQTFILLQGEGEEAAITFIKETMNG